MPKRKGTNQGESVVLTAPVFYDGKPGDDSITDMTGGETRIKAGAGDDTVRLVWSPGDGPREYAGGSGVDRLEIEILDYDYEAFMEAFDAELAAYESFLASHTNPSGQATGQSFTFQTLGLTVKQFESVSLTVIDTNDPPDAVDDALTASENGTTTLDVLANDTDPDGDALTVTGTTQPGKGTVSLIGGAVVFDAGSDFQSLAAGETEDVTFEYTITDGAEEDTATVTLTVVGANDAPVAVNDAFTVSESGTATLDVLANDTDIDGDTLTVTGLTQPVEGSVSVVGGAVVFDPGTDFAGLSAGQTATVSFDYTISDGIDLAAATVTLTVEGEGVFDPGEISDFDTEVGSNGQPVTATLTTQARTNDGTTDATVEIGFGAVVQPEINVMVALDVSASTIYTGPNIVQGATVGDFNGDGRANTVLDVELAAVLELATQIEAEGFPDGAVTFTIIPFASNVQGVHTFTLDDGSDLAQIEFFLRGRNGMGGTNYSAPLDAARSRFTSLDPDRDETNLLYFLSDGDPNAGDRSPAGLSGRSDILENLFGAQISAIGIGNNVNPMFLNYIDNTGGAQIVTDPNQLSAALVGSPIPASSVLDADVFVFDEGGTQVDAFDLDPGDFTATPLGLTADISDLSGLDAYAGGTSTVKLVISLDSDDDGVEDTVLETEVSVEGVLPESVDLMA